jgi:putative RecB family exonuclease
MPKGRGISGSKTMSLVPYLSASSYGTYIQCPRQFYFDKILKYPKQPPGDAAEIGTYVHTVLERLCELPVEDRNMINAKRLMTEEWDKFKGTDVHVLLEMPDIEFKHAVNNCVSNALVDFFDRYGGDVVYLEKKFEVEVEGVPILGYVDLTVKVPGSEWTIVCDTKSGKPPKPAYIEPKLFQPLMYGAAYREMGERVDEVELLYVKTGDRVGCIVTDARLDGVTGKLRKVWDEIHDVRQEWSPKVSVLCHWCDHLDKCPEGRIQDENYMQRMQYKGVY